MTDARNPREAWVALVLSLVCPGLGHVYAGLPARGLLLFSWFVGFVPFTVLLFVGLPPGTGAGALVALSVVTLLSYGFAIVDSAHAAKRQPDYELASYNRGAAYLFLAIVGLANWNVGLFLVRTAVVEVFVIPTASMAPNIVPGDRLLVNKLRIGVIPERGTLVVFRQPEDREQMYVKRVIGLPGDTIQIKDHRIFLNGKQLSVEQVPHEAVQGSREHREDVFEEACGSARYRVILNNSVKDYGPITVPKGSCFVLGDNRPKSRDSRAFSFVPLGDIHGHVDSICWPSVSWRRFGTLN